MRCPKVHSAIMRYARLGYTKLWYAILLDMKRDKVGVEEEEKRGSKEGDFTGLGRSMKLLVGELWSSSTPPDPPHPPPRLLV